MTITEFKAWLEGFEEAIDGKPNQAQWKKIREKLNSVAATNEIVKYEHIWRPLYPWYYWQVPCSSTPPYTVTCTSGSSISSQASSSGISAAYMYHNQSGKVLSWYEQGKKDAA